MRKHKKIAALFLAGAMMATLAGCSSSGSASSAPASAPASQSTAADSSAATQPAEWPTGTVTVYVPANAGSGTDMMVRLYTDVAAQLTGQDFVVVNDNTGQGVFAYETVANAAADGHTLLFTNNLFLHYYNDIYNQFAKDLFTPVAYSSRIATPYLFVVNPSVPVASWDEFVEYTQDHEVVVGCQYGGLAELILQSIKACEGINQDNVVLVDAGGSSDRLAALLGGNVNATLLSPREVDQYVGTDEMTTLLVCDTERYEPYGDVPCTTEKGMPSAKSSLLESFFYVPKETPTEVDEAINELFCQISQDPEVIANFEKLGMVANGYDLQGCEELQQTSINDTYEAVSFNKDLSSYQH